MTYLILKKEKKRDLILTRLTAGNRKEILNAMCILYWIERLDPTVKREGCLLEG